ncbi:hypothetical protein OG21DRAFT_1525665 [Imleria badia]|nr:hypothetical protein OG21DRAFT_1525665 [Imleria badia]
MPRQLATRHLHHHHCGHCGQGFPTPAGVRRHIGHSPRCQAAALRRTAGGQHAVDDQTRRNPVTLHGMRGTPEPQQYAYEYDQGPAAEVLGSGPTVFETMKDVQEAAGQGVYSPFADREEWELADWLIRNVNQRATDELLKLSIPGYLQTRNRTQPSYRSKYTFTKVIDQLPMGPEWHCELVRVHGDDETHGADQDPGNEGADRSSDKELELWLRNPVTCVQELLGNLAFCAELVYKPEKVYTNPQGQTRCYDEMWMGKWWWETQVVTFACGATVAPVILASDKTQLSRFKGDKVSWPVYLTIGNISKEVDADTFENNSVGRYRLFHYCMRMRGPRDCVRRWADQAGLPDTCSVHWGPPRTVLGGMLC